MRKFDYRKDYGIIPTTIRGYLKQIEKNLRLLVEREKNPLYNEALKFVIEFNQKYPNLSNVYSRILDDLLSKYSADFCYEKGYYPSNASQIGMEFEQDLRTIIDFEEKLGVLAAQAFQNRLTPFEDIVNGEEFMAVGHASYRLPGTVDCSNYQPGSWKKQYLSCSLFTGREFNAYNGSKKIYIVDVNEENYISSSGFDSVTHESAVYDFLTVKQIDESDCTHYINAGYTHDQEKAVTIILTPELVEQMSIERETKAKGELFSYEGVLTNEVITDRSKTTIKGALLIGAGCDLMISEFLSLKEQNVKFKCINKGIYREKNGLPNYTKKEFDEFISSLRWLEENVKSRKISPDILYAYYLEVVLPMKYSSEILDIIRATFGKYVELPEEPARQMNIK